jgi:3'(2'), 5'-bisphosphate nucleotidase
MPVDLTDVGPILADICEEAGRLVLPLWKSGLTVHTKADESPVTEADRQGEALILERLSAAFPGVPVISEEDASEFGTPDAIGRQFFLVDPVDGTKAFVRGDPNFTVNIALVEDGRPIAGAVTAPASDETWFTSGCEAWKRASGGEAVRITARPWPEGAAIALVSHTMKPETVQALADKYGFATPQPMDSSIKFCRLAEGSADIYPRHGPTMEWDIAAGHAVLVLAGGSMVAEDGSNFVYGKADKGFRNGWFIARGA